MTDFVHLKVHSYYSFCQGASSITELVGRAANLGMKQLALTDKNGLYGAVAFYREARKSGLNPIIGAEVDDPENPSRSATVLAADRNGFSSLCRLITKRHLDNGFDLSRTLAGLGPGCLVLTGDMELLSQLAATTDRNALYGEISPRSLLGGGGNAHHIIDVSSRLGIRPVATGDVYFAEPQGFRLHTILKAIGSRKTVHSLNREGLALPRQYLSSESEMAKLFREFPQALQETGRLAERCRLKLDTGCWKFPSVPLPEGESAFSCLWKLAADGLARRYRPVTAKAARRLVHELEVIEAGGFAPYFLLVHDILRQADQWGLRHVGRGSAANSLVSYCLGFTAVDPLSLELYFERFLNPARKSPPDIDLDFSWKERDRILEYVYRRYGDDKVAMISTHVTFGPRAAVREVARVLGIGPEEISRITRYIPHWGPVSLKNLQKTVPECANLPLDADPWAKIMSIAENMLGFPRHVSVHPSGIIVAPEPLFHWCPLEKAPSGLAVIQYDMFGTEEMGLIKIDLLSQRSLGVLEDALSCLSTEGRTPPVENLPLVFADDKTRSLVREGRTMGCFYIESPAMRSLLRKLETDTFEGLTAASSVIRPGVAESGMMASYIERHRHPEKASFLHPLLKTILGKTYGVMIYQEDVIRVAHLVAGLSLSEADLLRRSMSGKMRSRKAMADLRSHFLHSSRTRGVSEKLARELWRQIESFAGYAFCKAHSASYAVLSLQLAYLKAHHPAVFMSAVLSNGGGYYSAAAYIQECRRLGIRILPPDVNRSLEPYTAEEGALRVGFMSIKGLSVAGMRSLLESRLREGPFSQLWDLVQRTTLSPKDLDLLVRCGACDTFGQSRPELLWHLASLNMKGLRQGDGFLIRGVPPAPVPRLKDYTLAERCAAEHEILGFTTAVHPLELFRGRIPPDVITASLMGQNRDRKVIMAGWPIAFKRVRTKKGRVMKFLSLEDLTGTFETVLFPDVYRRVAHLTVSSGPLLIEGMIAEEYGVFTLVARRVQPITGPKTALATAASGRETSLDRYRT